MPMQPRSRIGMRIRPLDMYCILAIWLTISPTESRTKSANMKSTTGRVPVIAAPPASPTNPRSAIGVSQTRDRAVLVEQPVGRLEVSAPFADPFADHKDPRVHRHFVGQRLPRGLHVR